MFEHIKDLKEYIEKYHIDTKLCCDQIFALYLIHVGSKVKPKFYQAVAAFIDLYWACMNTYGYDMKKNFKVFVRNNKDDYTSKEDGYLIPKMVNIFT